MHKSWSSLISEHCESLQLSTSTNSSDWQINKWAGKYSKQSAPTLQSHLLMRSSFPLCVCVCVCMCVTMLAVNLMICVFPWWPSECFCVYFPQSIIFQSLINKQSSWELFSVHLGGPSRWWWWLMCVCVCSCVHTWQLFYTSSQIISLNVLDRKTFRTAFFFSHDMWFSCVLLFVFFLFAM